MQEPKLITRAERLARKQKGLGDIVSSVATPIAAALKMPCVDPATKQLRPNSLCAKRKEKLNRATEKVRAVLSSLVTIQKD